MSAFILACWVGFFGYWLYSMNRVKATVERQSQAARLQHSIPLLAAYLLLAWNFRRFGLGVRLLPDAAWVVASGALLVALGLATAIWSRRTLGGNWSSAVTLKEGHTLVQRGPYRWVRNPIYTGLLAMVVGTAIAIGRVRGLGAVALAGLSFWIKLKQEEQFMLRQFPVEYPAYKRRVKALVPFLF